MYVWGLYFLIFGLVLSSYINNLLLCSLLSDPELIPLQVLQRNASIDQISESLISQNDECFRAEALMCTDTYSI